MKKILLFSALAVLIAMMTACDKKAQDNSVITVHFPDEANRMMVRLSDYDTGEQLENATVADGVAVFNGNVETPALVRITLDGQRYCSLIREAGKIDVDSTRTATGGELNNRMNELDAQLSAIIAEADKLERDSTYETKIAAIQTKIMDFLDSAVKDNADNPIGYYYCLQQAYEMDEQGLKDLLKVYPQVAEHKRIKDLLEAYAIKAETGEGKKLKDFEVT